MRLDIEKILERRRKENNIELLLDVVGDPIVLGVFKLNYGLSRGGTRNVFMAMVGPPLLSIQLQNHLLHGTEEQKGELEEVLRDRRWMPADIGSSSCVRAIEELECKLRNMLDSEYLDLLQKYSRITKIGTLDEMFLEIGPILKAKNMCELLAYFYPESIALFRDDPTHEAKR